ncbi:unnamed protein product [Rhodiola kirilowii]
MERGGRRSSFLCVCFVFFFALLFDASTAQMPGFVSLDCGGEESFTDELGLNWTPDAQMIFGQTALISIANETRKQYATVRHFPADKRKYCYTLNVMLRTRYLVRATFLYGNFEDKNVFPKFDVSVGPTHWSTVVISDANTIEVIELIFLATERTESVCLYNGNTGQPFISTLELRKFNGSAYHTDFENQFYLGVSARINFGAETDAPVRYPDDLFDRIWESDTVKKANYLVDVAAGTQRISTDQLIDTNKDERPPVKVMQTAVVGRNGTLTYRLNLDGFPGFGWAVTYFAEIEDLGTKESRKFSFLLPGNPDLSKAIVNIQENAHGKYRLYEPGFNNITLPFVLSFTFAKTVDSTRGPLINAIEISKYVQKADASADGAVLASVVSQYRPANWTQEGGDPCLPVPWTWVECNSDPQPRITSIRLSGMNLTGNIPLGLTKLSDLVELWLDGNSLQGPIPDFGGCTHLKIIHLENNQLTGELPSYLSNLPNLRELYVQNNMLTGKIPRGLFIRSLPSNYSGNDIHGVENGKSRSKIILRASVGAVVLLVLIVLAILISHILIHVCKKRCSDQGNGTLPPSPRMPSLRNAATEAAHCFTFREIEEATRQFGRVIGSGGFGNVYHGIMNGGKEIAVKVSTSNSYHRNREFTNEVALLSRIHHRYLVEFLGYCQHDEQNMLVYEFMHNGNLKEHINGARTINWIKRLEVAEDAARGIEYLHTGCAPAIIHMDLKTTNILLDKNMRAKVSDFGLSKLVRAEGDSRISSRILGTYGYLDPEYLASLQPTDKSDVYSFGVILLELISGQDVISTEKFGPNFSSIIDWAKHHIKRGEIESVIDPSLNGHYKIDSMCKIANTAMECLQRQGCMRPSMCEVIKVIQDALSIERRAEAAGEGNSKDGQNVAYEPELENFRQ